jgi:hypothetical protein
LTEIPYVIGKLPLVRNERVKPRNVWLWISYVPAEIQAHYFRNTNVIRYRYTRLLSELSCFDLIKLAFLSLRFSSSKFASRHLVNQLCLNSVRRWFICRSKLCGATVPIGRICCHGRVLTFGRSLGFKSINPLKMQSQTLSYVTNDGQSSSLSCCQTTVWDPLPISSFSFNFTLYSCGFYCGRPLWREEKSVIYIRCWTSPAHSVLDLLSAGLLAGFSCLKKNGVFWDVTPCGSFKNRRFGFSPFSVQQFMPYQKPLWLKRQLSHLSGTPDRL